MKYRPKKSTIEAIEYNGSNAFEIIDRLAPIGIQTVAPPTLADLHIPLPNGTSLFAPVGSYIIFTEGDPYVLTRRTFEQFFREETFAESLTRLPGDDVLDVPPDADTEEHVLLTVAEQQEILKLLDGYDEPIVPYSEDPKELQSRVQERRRTIVAQARNRVRFPRPPQQITPS